MTSKKTHKCPNCEKMFSARQSKHKHMSLCINKTNNNDLQVQILHLKDQISQLEKQMYIPIINTQNNTTNNITQNNFNIIVRDLGSENKSYLTKELLSECFANKDLVKLIDNIHCDTNHQENHNVRIKSLKRDLMEVKQNGRWIIADSDETLTTLIQNGYTVLDEHSRKHKDHIMEEELAGDDTEFRNIKDWLDDVYNNDSMQKPIKRKLLILFLNNKTLLLEKASEDDI